MNYLLILFLRALVFPGFTFIVALALLYDWVERKVEARMENRVGPLYTGLGGILQPLADYIKLFTKEDITPRSADRILFTIAPPLTFTLIVFAFYLIPIDGRAVIAAGGSGFEGDLIVLIALTAFANLMIFVSGWASTNPYGTVGAVRVLTQFIGYDVQLTILALSPAFLARSLSISTIAMEQPIPIVLITPWSFLLFLITVIAEAEKDPLDIPHAETEVVAGYATEFSGKKLAFLRLSKDLQTVMCAALVSSLFLGGPFGPTPFGLKEVWYTVWFILKLCAVILLIEFVGVVCARLRIDQFVRSSWRLMMPLSLLSLMMTVGSSIIIRTLWGA